MPYPLPWALCRSCRTLLAGTVWLAMSARGFTDETAAAPAAKPAAGRGPIVVTEQARQIHARALLIDGHNDLPWNIRTAGNTFESVDIARSQPQLHTDIPRLRAGGVGAQFWSVWVPVSTMENGSALRTTLEQIDLVKRMIAHYADDFELALTADDVERIHRGGKVASLIGVEGGHSIEDSLNVLRQLYQLGARYMTLTHTSTLSWADSGTDEERHNGLTDFGKQVVREMNRLGMLVDLSHVSAECMRVSLEISQAPVIFSHSSARQVADHPRNVPDDVLRLTARSGGVVMVNFYTGYVHPQAAHLSADRMALYAELKAAGKSDELIRGELKRWDTRHPLPLCTIHDVLDHIDHIAHVAGVDHVGLGSDFDGVDRLPDQLEDVSKYPFITQGLLDRGYSEAEICQILGGNVLRALREAESVAARLSVSP